MGRRAHSAICRRDDRSGVHDVAADSRSGRNGGALPWALLVAGTIASLAANVAVAESTLIGREIAAWPSFALTASYELLIRQVRRSAGWQVCPASTAAATETCTARDSQAQAGHRGCGSWVRPGLARVTGTPVETCGGRRGTGRWLTGMRTEACPAAKRSPVPMAAGSGGAGSSRVLA